jgi:hypothetical protein
LHDLENATGKTPQELENRSKLMKNIVRPAPAFTISSPDPLKSAPPEKTSVFTSETVERYLTKLESMVFADIFHESTKAIDIVNP